MQIECGAAKFVSARFGDHVDQAASRSAELRRVTRRHHLKFLNRFLWNGVSVIGALAAANPAEKGLVIVSAVNLNVGVDAALARERDLTARGVVRDCGRCELDKVLETTAIDGQIVDTFLVKESVRLDRSRLQALSRYRDSFRNSPDPECDVDVGNLPNLDQ